MSSETTSPFAGLALAPPILQAIEEIGYEAPSPIQAEAIPPLLAGRDLLGQAQTGTGKTAAFALPLLSRIDLDRRAPQLLVLTPTRELAIQVAEALQTYARHLSGFHILPVYGGQGMDTQLRQLRRGVHAVVGTPGRVMDHLRRGTLALDALIALVLDEADEMLRMGFIDDVEWILEHTPATRQTALFSATMPEAIRRVAQRHLRDPVEVRIRARTATVETVTQRYWQVSGLHKLDALTRILEVEEFDAMIVFVRTKTATLELAERLEARGYACSPLNGDMTQVMREKAIERLKRGDLDIIVATDVAARGLDVERVSHVLNYDIPNDAEAYVHRIGRTGRAGRKGEAILFCSPRERHLLRAIERATRQPIAPMQLPSREAVTDRRVERFKQLITETLESQELDFFEALIDGYQSEQDVGLSEVAAALAFLVQRERPLLIPEAAAPAEKTERRPAPERPVRPPRPTAPEKAPRPTGEPAEPKRPRPSGGSEGARSGRQPQLPMLCYRLEVGREHGVEPKHIVGAIANEAGIESRYMGRIQLFDTHSTIELPEGMPKDLFNHLKKVRVCGQPMRISLVSTPAESAKAGAKRARKAPRPKT